jgi:O-antigen/teichoic acid export membrane protein
MYLNASNNIKRLPIYWGITVIINIGLNLLLIPIYGIDGAAIASTISNIVIMVLVWKYFQKLTNISIKESFMLSLTDIKKLWQ